MTATRVIHTSPKTFCWNVLVHSRDSLIDQSFPTEDVKRTKESIEMFHNGVTHLEAYLSELMSAKLIEQVYLLNMLI